MVCKVIKTVYFLFFTILFNKNAKIHTIPTYKQYSGDQTISTLLFSLYKYIYINCATVLFNSKIQLTSESLT